MAHQVKKKKKKSSIFSGKRNVFAASSCVLGVVSNVKKRGTPLVLEEPLTRRLRPPTLTE